MNALQAAYDEIERRNHIAEEKHGLKVAELEEKLREGEEKWRALSMIEAARADAERHRDQIQKELDQVAMTRVPPCFDPPFLFGPYYIKGEGGV